MNFKLIDYKGVDYESMVLLRHEILRKPLGLVFSAAELENEKSDLLIGVFDDQHQLIGCCILSPVTGSLIKLRQMAIAENKQEQGVGKALLLFAEETAGKAGFNTIVLHARENAVTFYTKSGYDIIHGPFTEVTIPHYEMTKTFIHP